MNVTIVVPYGEYPDLPILEALAEATQTTVLIFPPQVSVITGEVAKEELEHYHELIHTALARDV